MQSSLGVLDVQTVENHLYALMREHRRVYVLVDRLYGHSLDDAFSCLSESSCPPVLGLSDPIFHDVPNRSPAIVALDFDRDEDAERLRRTVQIASNEALEDSKRTICAWLFAKTDIGSLAAALSRRLNMRYPTGKGIYLRYFDPRVMPRLQSLFNPRAGGAWLAPVETWCSLGRHHQWLRFDSFDQSTRSELPQITQSTSEAIDRIELINGAARMAFAAGHKLLHDSDEALDAALIEASDSGLTLADQQMQYAFLALTQGQAFTQHPSLFDWIELARNSGLPLHEIALPAMTSQTRTAS